MIDRELKHLEVGEVLVARMQPQFAVHLDVRYVWTRVITQYLLRLTRHALARDKARAVSIANHLVGVVVYLEVFGSHVPFEHRVQVIGLCGIA